MGVCASNDEEVVTVDINTAMSMCEDPTSSQESYSRKTIIEKLDALRAEFKAGAEKIPKERKQEYKQAKRVIWGLRWEQTQPITITVESGLGFAVTEAESREWERAAEVMYQLADYYVRGEWGLELDPVYWVGQFSLRLPQEEAPADPSFSWKRLATEDASNTASDKLAKKGAIDVKLQCELSDIRDAAQSVQAHMQKTGQKLTQPLFHSGIKKQAPIHEGMVRAGQQYKKSHSRTKGTWTCCTRDWLLPGCRMQHHGMP
eukprot:TRINITY_DN27401_c0_g1_i1.p1 TRINITY_DN27401_c0_g1~~TRINITY_DN27401_c0_g1_i1.p1  ORF type:complete len:260 (-),score=57.97 TRINITY_DN27401_c0_g1_i1:101-880(-)